MARATEGGSTGAAPENAAAVAAGQEAAEAAPTVAPGDAPQSETVSAGDATVTKVEPVGNAVAVEPAPAVEEAADSEAKGGTSFDYGFKDDGTGPTEDEVLAQKVAIHDASLRQDNPDVVVYRDAGSAGVVGGESFGYGQVEKSEEG